MASQSNISMQKLNLFYFSLYPAGKTIINLIQLCQQSYHLDEEGVLPFLRELLDVERKKQMILLSKIEIDNQVYDYVQLSEKGKQYVKSAIQNLYFSDKNKAMSILESWMEKEEKNDNFASRFYHQKISDEILPHDFLFASLIVKKQMNELQMIFMKLNRYTDERLSEMDQNEAKIIMMNFQNKLSTIINNWIDLKFLDYQQRQIQVSENETQEVTLFMLSKRGLFALDYLRELHEKEASEENIPIVPQEEGMSDISFKQIIVFLIFSSSLLFLILLLTNGLFLFTFILINNFVILFLSIFKNNIHDWFKSLNQ